MSAMLRVASVCLCALVCASSMPTATRADAGPGQRAFRSGVELVYLPVIVAERDGRLVHGLTVDDFEVVDGGVTQPIQWFAEGPPGETVPLYLGVMLDKSQSMEADRRAAASAVVKFIEAMPEATDVTFVEFNTSVRVSRFSPNSYERLYERIREPLRGRSTPLYDAIGRYIHTAGERQGTHLLVVYTDGDDSGRGLNAGEVQTLLRHGNVLMYAVAYLENQPTSNHARLRATLTALPRETGGEVFFPASTRGIDSIYERIRAEMAARYTIGYAMPADARAGEFRRVTVRLRDDRDRRRVRTRTGYIVPEP